MHSYNFKEAGRATTPHTNCPRLHNDPCATSIPHGLPWGMNVMTVSCQWDKGAVYILVVKREGKGWVVSDAPFPIEGTEVGFYPHKKYKGDVMKVKAKPAGAWRHRWTCLFWATGGPHHSQHSKFLAEKSARDLEVVLRETNKLLRMNRGMSRALGVGFDDFDDDELLAELEQELQFDKFSGSKVDSLDVRPCEVDELLELQFKIDEMSPLPGSPVV